MAALLKDTQRQPLVFHGGCIISSKKSFGAQHAKVFSTEKNLTKVAMLAASGGFILMFDLYAIQIEICVCPSQTF